MAARRPRKRRLGQRMAKRKRTRGRSFPRLPQSQERVSRAVTVRYECPLCGGPHSRADH